ncbi:MAG: FHA domain-containing protein [Thermodesulfobacteriota bacterium]
MKQSFVVVTLNNRVIERKKLEKELTTVGRARENDILIDNPSVSRHHAIIQKKGERFAIRDLESANGTFVNGRKVDSSELTLGDVVLIGKHALIYKEGALNTEGNSALQDEDGTVRVDAEAQERFMKRLGNNSLRVPKLMVSDGREIEINTDSFTIGNGNNSSLKLDGFFLKNTHARIIKQKDSSYKMVSVDSYFAPTRVNGTVQKEKVLQDGDIIQVGKYNLLFAL